MALVQILDADMLGEIVTYLPEDSYEFFPCYIHNGYTYVYITDGYINKLIVNYTEVPLPDPNLDSYQRVVDPVILTSHSLPEGQP
jgi:hypothetical protein